MKYPGENKITLNSDALMAMLSESLNDVQDITHNEVRVLGVSRSGYGSDLEFVITTDDFTNTPKENA
ncbi:hypothetical protein UFOVP1356_10 [uncultured Caudovirales phage]|uniref:Uncharacterized protein n=1 Tax=uncultured Caudovirales phage TaxID=2100421 RepID=A0A6J5S2S7_9CAUD|nr:hypothetical protein UFOVP1356_10 [uncultured Caudovirales phage]